MSFQVFRHNAANALHVSSLGLNLVLLYLIVKHSKFQTSTYKHIFGFACVNDILLSLSAVLCGPVS